MDDTSPKRSSYRRINHAEKWLSRLQAREKTPVAKEVIDDVKKQLQDMGITDMKKVTRDLIRECLRKIVNAPPKLTKEEYALILQHCDEFKKQMEIESTSSPD